MIKQESWRVESAEGSFEDRANRSVEQFDSLMAEMLAENERLRKLASQRGTRMQILYDYIWEKDRNVFMGRHPEALDWFDVDGVPK